MSRKKAHTPEEIVSKLRQVDVLADQGKAVAEAVRAIGVTEATYYRWRAEWASPLGVEGLLANPAALLLSFGSKTTVFALKRGRSDCRLPLLRYGR
ncbi:MAG: helix-turn-helix domain-containing protein [Rhodopila sp.]